MEINKYIDHTKLSAYATHEDIKKLCEEAKKHVYMAKKVQIIRELIYKRGNKQVIIER